MAKAPSRTGGPMPLHCTAIGKALLAHASAGLQKEVLAGPLERRAPRTVVAPGALRRQLREITETGVAFERESTVGLMCVAAPVLGRHNEALAAISVAGPTGRFRPDRFVTQVRAAATGLGSTLHRRNLLS
ncbi:IclR family transcriptional regulator C-terminal domain-containing protein [Streptomyces sp. NPDC047117]|uniref:IclR family transcriptional regulator C-terminal domain-containing protein n=1 Tax=Streptomyces sp. NPDC047117 TaxID=3155379 RepID=UPI0033C845CD